MKTLFKKSLATSSHSILTSSECKKETPLPRFYFECKIDGRDYVPRNLPHCRVAKMSGHTKILISANRGFETIGISIIKPHHIPITTSAYKLAEDPRQGGTYKNSATVNDNYDTDSLHTGILEITFFDSSTKVISGIFSFLGHNSAENKTISIHDGKFCLQYSALFNSLTSSR